MSRRDSWKSARWGGGGGWGTRARFKSNYRGWLESSRDGGWGGSLSRLGERIGNAEWGKRARIRTALSGAYDGRNSGVRSAWGSNDPRRGTDGGWFAAVVVEGPLSSLMPGGGKETDAPGYDEQLEPELPEAVNAPGAGPPRDRIIPAEDFDALRDRCVEEIAALALHLAQATPDVEIVTARLAALIGAKYAPLVVEWAGEHPAATAAQAKTFAVFVVEAAMYDRREKEPVAWKIYRLIRRLVNGKTETEAALQIRAAADAA